MKQDDVLTTTTSSLVCYVYTKTFVEWHNTCVSNENCDIVNETSTVMIKVVEFLIFLKHLLTYYSVRKKYAYQDFDFDIV